ncbi:hypothetical protein JOF53_000176 [Crossiella equi]|uniref:DUF3955 domain-containing protein n=1 Tax=Crossiella equi TaxID=130796 RepID=A0ABS5A402_9PSEU|nr:hypothetical protein [Crossiella equi]MBP2471304.1 hypothetical protein [Crossiella equi]
MAKTKSGVETVQGVLALAGITLGLVPLGFYLFTGRHSGPFRLLFGEPDGTMAYLTPVLVIAVVLLAIGFLERYKSKA